ncbi:MAG: UvrD-helicase domain-containing protein [Pseudomonadota bacterium]
MSQALDPAHSITLLASAGTGKTWTLTARIVRLLLAGAEPGGILALTFTRKAAAEMRARVASRLQTLAFADDCKLKALLDEIGADDDAATRQRARELFEQYTYAETPLRASTLHVFCAEVLSRFALEAEVPAGFALIENERELRGEAIEAVLRQAHRDDSSALAQALDTLAQQGLSEFDVRSVLQTLFEHRAELWAAVEGEADPLAALRQQLEAALPFSADEDPYGATDAPALNARLTMLQRMLEAQGDVGSVKAKRLARAIECKGAVRYAVLADALLRADGEPYAFKPAKAKYTAPQADTVIAHFRDVSAAAAAVRQAVLRAATYQRSSAALTLGVAALDAFAQSLHRSHQLGFAELEWQTVRLLRREGSADWVRYKLDQKLEHVLLDEFQDTSPTQWRLLLPLLQEFATRNEGTRTVFLVGDGKQSIYGFRRAEPALLGIAGGWLREHLQAVTESLDQSRRSAPAIITFVNALFADEVGARINFTPHRTALAALNGSVEIAPLILPEEKPEAANDAALRNPLTTPREIGEDRRAAEEAQWVVDRITQLVDRATPVTERDGTTRAMHFGDVMVLARHRTHLGVLEKTLGANGIPYSSATRGTLLDTAIAQDLLALLAVLDSPHRDLDLAHALRSPLFSVSDEELLWLADAARAASQGWFATLALAGAATNLQRAHQLLTQWRALAQGLPPHDLIDRIVSEGDLLRRCRAARPHDTLLGANLAALLQLALDSDHGRYPTLGGFLRHCVALHEGQGPDEAPPPSSEARVRVMTIHAAKGLEAPAVFLVNSAPSPRPAHAGWRVNWPAEAERPEVIVQVGKAEQREALSLSLLATERDREDREALNLLYVAVTRAQQYLFVSGFQSGRSVQTESWHARCRTALASLLPAAGEAQSIWQHAEGNAPALTQQPAPRAAAPTLDPRLLQPLSQPQRIPSRSPLARDGSAALRGEVIHAVLQGLCSGPFSDEALRARVQQQLGLPLPEALWRDALREARGVLEAPALAGFFDPNQKSWNEVALHVETEEGVQVNVLDRLVDTGAALWVIDYKTHRAGDAASVLDGAAAQLRRYVAAVQRLFPARAVRAGVIWTAEAQLLELS